VVRPPLVHRILSREDHRAGRGQHGARVAAVDKVPHVAPSPRGRGVREVVDEPPRAPAVRARHDGMRTIALVEDVVRYQGGGACPATAVLSWPLPA
jgi:hypothetical protein